MTITEAFDPRMEETRKKRRMEEIDLHLVGRTGTKKIEDFGFLLTLH